MMDVYHRTRKIAYVSPIFKRGAKDKVQSYRPISLTSMVYKLMESIVQELIMIHMRARNLLSTKQYSFINELSTLSQ